MRVLTITTFFPNAADRQRAIFVRNLVQAMKQHCGVDVISPVPYVPPFLSKPEWRAQRAIPTAERVDAIEIAHPRFVVLPKLGWFSGVGYFLGIFRTLRRLAKGNEPIVLHVHCAYPDAVGVALAAKVLGLPYFVTAHGSDINVYAELPTLRFQIRWALRHAAGVIAVSSALEVKIRGLVGNAKVRIAGIPCAAFDPQVFAPVVSAEGENNQSPRVAVFVGQLVPIKGVEFLVEAWGELFKRGIVGKMDRLLLIGDGPCRNALELQVENAGLDGMVQFAGMLSQAEVARLIATAKLLCLPSRNEGTPNVVVEALASGVPIVASRVGGIPDLVRDGENGLLVIPGDVPALADALAQVLERNWNAKTIAASVANRTWMSIARQNVELFQSILHDHDAIT